MRTLALTGILAASFVTSLAAQTPLTLSGLPAAAPMTVTAKATTDQLIVELALEPEWHVYARDVGGGSPVTVRLADDGDFVAKGALELPPDDAGKLTGEVELRLPLARRGTGTKLCATLDLMVCDALQCLPPMSVEIAGDVPASAAAADALSVLLVVDALDTRSERIEAFLRERGFEVDVTDYPKVTALQCDGHAVVLADSKLFGKTAKVRQHVLEFPRTKTPIVAVGFFGTELIEAHGIAMTSGYI